MRDTTLAITFGLALAAASVTAHAQQDFYWGINHAFVDYKPDNATTARPTVAVLTLGTPVYNFNNRAILSVEGRAGFGLSDHTAFFRDPAPEAENFSVDVKIEHMYGAYLKGSVVLHELVSVYALAGFTEAKLKYTLGDDSFSESDNGPSYGIGLDLTNSAGVTLNLEWARILDEDNYIADSLSLGIYGRF